MNQSRQINKQKGGDCALTGLIGSCGTIVALLGVGGLIYFLTKGRSSL